jgi:TPR repeat protein
MQKTLPFTAVLFFCLSTACAAKSDKERILEAHGKMSEEMKKDPQRYQRECDQGKAHSCTREGVFYAFGTWGHTKDYSKAKPLFEKACHAGDQDGCKELAVLYHYGRGVPKDQAKALDIYTRACDAKNSTSCYYGAELHQYGRGTPKDMSKAKAMFAKACSYGYKSACNKKL